MNAKDLAARITPEVESLWPDDPDARHKATQLAGYIATITHNYREGWGKCRCGKEFHVWVADDFPETADMLLEMHENPNIDSCQRCKAEFLERVMKESDHCPEGDCTLGYSHIGRCAPFRDTQAYRDIVEKLLHPPAEPS